jgi:mono/diheme cytochrome c family protein
VTGFRISTLTVVVAFAAGASLAQSPPPPAAPPPGQAIFERVCGDCHAYAPEDDRAPPLDVLRRMSAEQIRAALTVGVMAGVGETLSPDEVRDVAVWLGSQPGSGPAPATPSR